MPPVGEGPRNFLAMPKARFGAESRANGAELAQFLPPHEGGEAVAPARFNLQALGAQAGAVILRSGVWVYQHPVATIGCTGVVLGGGFVGYKFYKGDWTIQDVKDTAAWAKEYGEDAFEDAKSTAAWAKKRGHDAFEDAKQTAAWAKKRGQDAFHNFREYFQGPKPEPPPPPEEEQEILTTGQYLRYERIAKATQDLNALVWALWVLTAAVSGAGKWAFQFPANGRVAGLWWPCLGPFGPLRSPLQQRLARFNGRRCLRAATCVPLVGDVRALHFVCDCGRFAAAGLPVRRLGTQQHRLGPPRQPPWAPPLGQEEYSRGAARCWCGQCSGRWSTGGRCLDWRRRSRWGWGWPWCPCPCPSPFSPSSSRPSPFSPSTSRA